MNPHDQDAEALIASALTQGEIIVPQRLLDAVAEISSPADFLLSAEPQAAPFDAIREEYPALHSWRSGGRAMNAEATAQAVALLRWVLRELADWSSGSDPRRERMIAVMVALNQFGLSDAHWVLLSDTAVNAELIKLLCTLLKGYRCEIQGEPGQRASKTKDLGTSLAKADSEEDWAAISAIWQQIETWLT